MSMWKSHDTSCVLTAYLRHNGRQHGWILVSRSELQCPHVDKLKLLFQFRWCGFRTVSGYMNKFKAKSDIQQKNGSLLRRRVCEYISSASASFLPARREEN